MPLDLGGLFKKGGAKLIEVVGDALDKNITNKEEREAAKLAATQEANRHLEAMAADATRQLELENQDRASARSREVDYIKATGHQDYIMWFLGVSAILIFSFMVWHLVKEELPEANRELMYHTMGIIEGVIISIYTYYWGSSAKSRGGSGK